MNQEPEKTENLGVSGRLRKVSMLESLQTQLTPLRTTEELNQAMQNMYPGSPMMKALQREGRAMLNEKVKGDAIRIGWALFHWLVVSVFISGIYMAISIWRVSNGAGFVMRAPVVWAQDKSKEYVDIDGMEDNKTMAKNHSKEH